METLFKVIVNDAIRLDCVADEGLSLKSNDWCIIRNQRYDDYGRVVYAGPMPESMDSRDLPRVLRQATLVDQGKAHENRVRGKSLHRVAQEKVTKHDLPMNLVDTHLSFDRNLVLFMFLAPGRVDFRELLKDLNKAVQMRVELRQIGPRDQAGMVGGIGSCGRNICCVSYLRSFVSINVRMAKAQELSLNPSNIIGACGRLKCCLQFEYEGYQSLLSNMPKVGAKCECSGGCGRVVDRNILLQTVTVQLADKRVVDLPAADVTPQAR